jgi:adenylyltransferase/sulfurtransferase
VRLLTPAEFLASFAGDSGQRQTFSDADRGAYHVVDVRPASEASGLKGALHVPLEEIAARWTECVSDRPTVFVCQAGVRSLTAAQLLAEKGKTAFSLVGGLSALNELQRGRS